MSHTPIVLDNARDVLDNAREIQERFDTQEQLFAREWTRLIRTGFDAQDFFTLVLGPKESLFKTRPGGVANNKYSDPRGTCVVSDENACGLEHVQPPLPGLKGIFWCRVDDCESWRPSFRRHVTPWVWLHPSPTQPNSMIDNNGLIHCVRRLYLRGTCQQVVHNNENTSKKEAKETMQHLFNLSWRSVASRIRTQLCVCATLGHHFLISPLIDIVLAYTVPRC
jgi:hypothetical protein